MSRIVRQSSPFPRLLACLVLLLGAVLPLQAWADVDTDNDGLFDNEEAQFGTDPANADSDNDGIVDGWEVLLGDNPSVGRYTLTGTTELWFNQLGGGLCMTGTSINGAITLKDDERSKSWRTGPQTGAGRMGLFFTPPGQVTLSSTTSSYTSVGFTCVTTSSTLTCQRESTSYSKSLTGSCVNTSRTVSGTDITPSPWSVPVNNPLAIATARDMVCTLNKDFTVQCFDVSNWGGAASATKPGVTLFFDADKDGVQNSDDLDDDNDGTPDVSDPEPFNPFVGGVANPDFDNDGVLNDVDNCRLKANTDQLNTDGDAFGDACDSDDDNDGVPDSSDAFPFNAAESVDTDHDGIGNNADGDDDGDGIPDYIDANPLNPAIKSENLLPLNGTYKGGQVREVQIR